MVTFYWLQTFCLGYCQNEFEFPVSIRRRNSKNTLSTEGMRLSFEIGLKMFIIIKQKVMHLFFPLQRFQIQHY